MNLRRVQFDANVVKLHSSLYGRMACRTTTGSFSLLFILNFQYAHSSLSISHCYTINSSSHNFDKVLFPLTSKKLRQDIVPMYTQQLLGQPFQGVISFEKQITTGGMANLSAFHTGGCSIKSPQCQKVFSSRSK